MAQTSPRRAGLKPPSAESPVNGAKPVPPILSRTPYGAGRRAGGEGGNWTRPGVDPSLGFSSAGSGVRAEGRFRRVLPRAADGFVWLRALRGRIAGTVRKLLGIRGFQFVMSRFRPGCRGQTESTVWRLKSPVTGVTRTVCARWALVGVGFVRLRRVLRRSRLARMDHSPQGAGLLLSMYISHGRGGGRNLIGFCLGTGLRRGRSLRITTEYCCCIAAARRAGMRAGV